MAIWLNRQKDKESEPNEHLTASDFTITAVKNSFMYINVKQGITAQPPYNENQSISINIISQPNEGSAEDSFGGRILFRSKNNSSDTIKYKIQRGSQTSNEATITINLTSDENATDPNVEKTEIKSCGYVIEGNQDETIIVGVDYGNQTGFVGLLFDMYGAPDFGKIIWNDEEVSTESEFSNSTHQKSPSADGRVGGMGMLKLNKDKGSPNIVYFYMEGTVGGGSWRGKTMCIDWSSQDIINGIPDIKGNWGKELSEQYPGNITSMSDLQYRLDKQTEYSNGTYIEPNKTEPNIRSDWQKTMLKNLTINHFLPDGGGIEESEYYGKRLLKISNLSNIIDFDIYTNEVLCGNPNLAKTKKGFVVGSGDNLSGWYTLGDSSALKNPDGIYMLNIFKMENNIKQHAKIIKLMDSGINPC